ncbi:MAG TPA: rod shape-determining protein MreC [Anaerolineae bacterium]|nr:rod shape-determining protein MreC [Anaerolineae bacterium]
MTRERFNNLIPVLLIVITLIGLVSHRAGLLQPVESLFLRVTAPLQEGISGIAGQFGQVAQTARDLRTLRQRNEELEAENARLLLDNVRLREIAVEAALLRDLLNVPQASPSFEVQGARVVGRIIGQDPSNLQHYVILDVGQEAGIERNMPVVNYRGLVGRIAEAGVGWSRVLLITDMSSAINALTQSTRASGLVQGQPDGSLVMRNIPQGDTVSVGDTVFTSGLGGNFPRQVLIGQVIEVQRKDYELYQTAVIQPTVDFDHLEAVLVITDFERVQPVETEAGP